MVNHLRKILAIGALLCLIMSSVGYAAPLSVMDLLSGDHTEIIGDQTTHMVPFDFTGNSMMVKIGLNQKEYRFILDTGAPTAVSDKIAREMGLEQKAEIPVTDSTGATKSTAITILPPFQIGAATVKNCAALVLDMGNLNAFGVRFDGILGSNILKLFNVKIDYQKQTALFSKESFLPGGVETAYRVKLIKGPVGHIFCALRIGQSTGKTVVGFDKVNIDTGNTDACYLNIPVEAMETMKPVLNSKIIHQQGNGGGGLFGVAQDALSRVTHLQLGDFGADNLPVRFTTCPDPMISNKFLSHFTVIINYPANEMILIPNKNPMMSNVPSYGFGARRDESGRIKVISIWEDSPAAKSGLEVDDEIVRCAVDGKTMQFEDILPLFLSDGGGALHLTIRNSAGERDLVLHKDGLLPGIGQ